MMVVQAGRAQCGFWAGYNSVLTNQRWGLPERAPGARVVIRGHIFILHREFPESPDTHGGFDSKQERSFFFFFLSPFLFRAASSAYGSSQAGG